MTNLLIYSLILMLKWLWINNCFHLFWYPTIETPLYLSKKRVSFSRFPSRYSMASITKMIWNIIYFFGSGALPGLLLSIIENKLWGQFLLSLAPAGGSCPSVYYPNPFPNPAGQSYPLINPTWPKIFMNFIIFNNTYLQAKFYQEVHQIQFFKW